MISVNGWTFLSSRTRTIEYHPIVPNCSEFYLPVSWKETGYNVSVAERGRSSIRKTKVAQIVEKHDNNLDKRILNAIIFSKVNLNQPGKLMLSLCPSLVCFEYRRECIYTWGWVDYKNSKILFWFLGFTTRFLWMQFRW